MERRRVAIEGGRYLLFFTFEDETAPRDAAEPPPAVEPTPEPERADDDV